jgi:hypothetical protein
MSVNKDFHKTHPEWTCHYCGFANAGLLTQCRICGSKSLRTQVRETGDVDTDPDTGGNVSWSVVGTAASVAAAAEAATAKSSSSGSGSISRSSRSNGGTNKHESQGKNAHSKSGSHQLHQQQQRMRQQLQQPPLTAAEMTALSPSGKDKASPPAKQDLSERDGGTRSTVRDLFGGQTYDNVVARVDRTADPVLHPELVGRGNVITTEEEADIAT